MEEKEKADGQDLEKKARFFIAIKDNKVIANWGGDNILTDDQVVELVLGGEKADRIEEIFHNEAVALDFHVDCYHEGWRLGNIDHLHSKGYASDGLRHAPDKLEKIADFDKRIDDVHNEMSKIHNELSDNKYNLDSEFRNIAHQKAMANVDIRKPLSEQIDAIDDLTESIYHTLCDTNYRELERFDGERKVFEEKLVALNKEVERLEQEKNEFDRDHSAH